MAGHSAVRAHEELVLRTVLGTFRSEDEDEYQCEVSVLSMRIRFEDRHLSKCACS